jgi:hypothetical protein
MITAMFVRRWSKADLRRTGVRDNPLVPVVASAIAVAVAAIGLIACSPHAQSPVAASATSQQATAQRPTGEVSPAGDIPDNQAFVAFTAADHAFTVRVPEGWARTVTPGGIEFTDKLNTIAIASLSTVVAPTVDSVTTLEVPAIAKSTHGYQPGKVTQVNRIAGQAILITYGADSAPNSVTGKVVPQSVERYEFYQSGKQVTITLSGATGADNVDPWRIVTDSFSWSP